MRMEISISQRPGEVHVCLAGRLQTLTPPPPPPQGGFVNNLCCAPDQHPEHLLRVNIGMARHAALQETYQSCTPQWLSSRLARQSECPITTWIDCSQTSERQLHCSLHQCHTPLPPPHITHLAAESLGDPESMHTMQTHGTGSHAGSAFI